MARVKLTPPLRLYGLGVVILAALVACAFRDTNAKSFLVPVAVAGVAYLLAIRELLLTPRFPRRVVVACLIVAAVWRVPFLMTPLGPDDDIARYIWDGRVQRFGYNPYIVIPTDRAFTWLHTRETRGLNNADVPSPYPAGAQLFFRAVTVIHESAFAFRIAFVFCDLAIVLLLLNMLHRAGKGEHWVLAYAWHPLLATEVAGSGHIDIVGVLLLLVSVAALGRGWRAIAAIAFALAVAVKFLPLVLIPLYWRRLRIRDGLLAVLVFGVLYLPFLNAGRIPIGSLGVFVRRFRFNAPVFAVLERVASPQMVAALAILVGLVTAVALHRKPPQCEPDACAWPMAASLACAPVVYPWYLLWVLPFLRSVTTLPLTVWTLSIFSTYLVWYLRPPRHSWQVPNWILLLEYGSGVTAAVIVWFLRRA
jgi:alpha-1,6-mannosyltransferase